MSATPKYLQRLNQVGYGLTGTGVFLLIAWLNPVDLPLGGVAVTLATGLAAGVIYRRLRRDSP